MSEYLYLLLAGVLGYLWGAIPFGFLYVRATKGIDLRQVGSGRTGGTNSLRAAGASVGIVTAFSDVFKGAAPILLVRLVLGDVLDPAWLPWVEVTAGAFAVIGHNWSVFLKFGGGAGTGPNVGWAAAVWWPTLLLSVAIVGGLLWGTGMASVASLAMAAAIPIAFTILYFTGVLTSPAYLVGGVVTALVVTWALRPNIKRLLNGTERVVGPAARREQTGEAQAGS